MSQADFVDMAEARRRMRDSERKWKAASDTRALDPEGSDAQHPVDEATKAALSSEQPTGGEHDGSEASVDLARTDHDYEMVPVACISVPAARLRPVGDVGPLMESIRDVGLISPIVITPDHVLISGAHRLEAFRQLGRVTIPARIVEVSELEAKLIEIDENLMRRELTVLERCEHLADRKEIFEQLHPDAKVGGAPGKAGGGKVAKSPGSGSFVADAVAKTGRGRSTIHEEVAIGSLPQNVRDLLRGTPVADRKGQLLAIAKRAPEEQLEAAEETVRAAGGGSRRRDTEASQEAPTATTDGSIFDDLPEFEELGLRLEAAREMVTSLMGGWLEVPGPQTDGKFPELEEMAAFLDAMAEKVQRELTPAAWCRCDGDDAECVTCAGKGWLSVGEAAQLEADGGDPDLGVT